MSLLSPMQMGCPALAGFLFCHPRSCPLARICRPSDCLLYMQRYLFPPSINRLHFRPAWALRLTLLHSTSRAASPLSCPCVLIRGLYPGLPHQTCLISTSSLSYKDATSSAHTLPAFLRRHGRATLAQPSVIPMPFLPVRSGLARLLQLRNAVAEPFAFDRIS